MARALHLDEAVSKETRYLIELEPSVDAKAALKEFRVTGSDNAIGKQILELGLPENKSSSSSEGLIPLQLHQRNDDCFIRGDSWPERLLP